MVTPELLDALASDLANLGARRMWFARGGVPPKHRYEILRRAAAKNIALSWDDLGKLARPAPLRRRPAPPDAGAAA